MPTAISGRAWPGELLVHPHDLNAVPVAEFPLQIVAIHEIAQSRVKRHYVIVLQIDLDEGLPIERILLDLHAVEHVAGEVEVLDYAEFGEVARDIASAVEQQAIPS